MSPTPRPVPPPDGIELTALQAAGSILAEGRTLLRRRGRKLGPPIAVGELCKLYLGLPTYRFRWAESAGHFGRVRTRHVTDDAGRRLPVKSVVGLDGRRIGTRTAGASPATTSRRYTLADVEQIVLGLHASGRMDDDRAVAILVQVWAQALVATKPAGESGRP